MAHLDVDGSREVTGPGLAGLVEVKQEDEEKRQTKLCETLRYLNLGSQGCPKPLPSDHVSTVIAYCPGLASLGSYPRAAGAVRAAWEEYGVERVGLR